jgi:hypothetical protein
MHSIVTTSPTQILSTNGADVKHKDSTKILKLLNLLSHDFYEFGHFITVGQNRVHYPNNPSATQEIQKKLSELTSRMAMVFLFAVFDEYNTDATKNVLTYDEKLRLNAFRHVRNSAAHGELFKRSPRNDNARKDYDTVMQSTNPLRGLSYDSNSCICANSGIELECLSYMQEITKATFSRLENP